MDHGIKELDKLLKRFKDMSIRDYKELHDKVMWEEESMDKKEFLKEFKTDREKYRVGWVHSDIHPKGGDNHLRQKKQYQDSIQDTLSLSTDFVIVGGDIALGSDAVFTRGDYDWYSRLKNEFIEKNSRMDFTQWWDIAGNHDNHVYEEYLKVINPNLSYRRDVGNVTFLLMSDDYKNYSAQQEISDETLTWWKQEVKDNQDKILINVTHNHALQHGIFRKLRIDSMLGMGVQGTRGMFYHMNHYPIDIWFSSHTHIPSYLKPITTVKSKNYGLYVDTASIRKDFFYQFVESRFIYFKEGSDYCLIRTRWHEKKKFVKCLDYFYKLSKPFEV